FPKNDDAATGRARSPRRRHLRRTMIVAVSASLLGAAAVTTSASAANDGSSAAATSHAAQSSNNSSGVLQQQAPAAVTGAADTGTPFNGTFTLQRFRQSRGALYAVGQLDGTLGDKAVSRTISLPVKAASNDVPGQAPAGPQGLAAPAQTAGACSILTLDLAPL